MRAEVRRGFKGKIAERVGCHHTFVTQVLSGTAHFSLEQAECLNGLLGHSDEASLHYSSLATLSRDDVVRVREELVKAIERVRGIIRPSENEALCAYSIDFYEVGGPDA